MLEYGKDKTFLFDFRHKTLKMKEGGFLFLFFLTTVRLLKTMTMEAIFTSLFVSPNKP